MTKIKLHVSIFRGTYLPALVVAGLLVVGSQMHAGVVVVQTTDPATLTGALGRAGMSITSVAATNGDLNQFGTFSNFSLIGNGVVMSSGRVVDVANSPSTFDSPSTDMGQSGTPEFDAYGPGRITNFNASFDVARLQVDFNLSQASAVAFDFVFGSIEYPNWVNQYSDSFLTFLDGTSPANQIVYDSLGAPIEVGTNFAGNLITSNTETAFGSPHGLLTRLTTTTGTLAAGNHTLLFEVGDVNDQILDSAVFLSNLRTAASNGGGPVTDGQVPLPSNLTLLSILSVLACGIRALRRFRLLAI